MYQKAQKTSHYTSNIRHKIDGDKRYIVSFYKASLIAVYISLVMQNNGIQTPPCRLPAND